MAVSNVEEEEIQRKKEKKKKKVDFKGKNIMQCSERQLEYGKCSILNQMTLCFWPNQKAITCIYPLLLWGPAHNIN